MRIIAHLDMDAFFASVEERERPYLKDQPIAVGSDPQGGRGRGVVSTANYPAREYGIRSATPIRKAWELSEQARREGKAAVVFITPDFKRYEDVSRRVMAAVERNIDKGLHRELHPLQIPPLKRVGREGALEQVSVDECFFDLSFTGSFEKAEITAKRIKKDILKKEKLTCSIGVGPNKLIAKIASDFRKPDGLTVIPREKVDAFLLPLSIRKIPGVGPKGEEKLLRLKIKTIGDARAISEEKLREMFGSPPHQLLQNGDNKQLGKQNKSWCVGKWGSELYRKFRGEDDSPVVTEAPPAKSIGEQETLPEDSLNMKVLLPYLEKQSKNLVRYMVKEGFKSFRSVVLTVRFADFETISHSRTLKEPTASAEILRRNVTQMFFPFLDRQKNPRRKKIRLVGVRIERFS